MGSVLDKIKRKSSSDETSDENGKSKGESSYIEACSYYSSSLSVNNFLSASYLLFLGTLLSVLGEVPARP